MLVLLVVYEANMTFSDMTCSTSFPRTELRKMELCLRARRGPMAAWMTALCPFLQSQLGASRDHPPPKSPIPILPIHLRKLPTSRVLTPLTTTVPPSSPSRSTFPVATEKKAGFNDSTTRVQIQALTGSNDLKPGR